ncbi:hypothetical protein EXIGLDRAFT_763404 [Exidia glandulosa HHB12029]|uniref:F-box domain-containing protein n=1 Tax=Exidia glandulosa HHB12029 TaxID=1314781 RepID=A0A165LZM4_EXIGL|nr:hypothetical protein EXIGLDRAFT_763404 [Exidia glandulosa HHB12029]
MSLGRLLPDWEHTLYRAVYGACTEVSKLLDGDRPADIIRPTNVAQPISMEFEFSLVLDVVWRTFQDYARSETKAHSPASRLPPEILSYIFAYLPFEGRISTSHVSHAWRTVSLDFPATLWASVPSTHNLDIMAPLLDRTAALGLPVDLMILWEYILTAHRLNREYASC